MVLLGSNRCLYTNCLVYLLAETSIYVPYPLIVVHATCPIGLDGSILIYCGLITFVACELPFHTIRQSPAVCQRMGLVGREHPFVDGLLTAACQVAFCFWHAFIRMHRAVEGLLLRRAIVGVRTVKGESERKRIVNIYIVQILMTVMMHSANARSCGVAVWAPLVPVSCIGNVETMVLTESIIHPQSVVVCNAKRLLPGFIIIIHTIVAKWMIGYAWRFTVWIAVYIFILCVKSKLASLQGKI